MKPLIGMLLVVLGLMGFGYYYYNIYPPQANRKIIQASLDEFAAAIASKDRENVSTALTNLLTDDAKITLNIHMFSIRTNSAPAISQQFNKEEFIRFIDNTLYPLTDYAYTPKLAHYSHDDGAVTFTSIEWADGANMMGGIAVNMRYSSDTRCEGNVVLADAVARLSRADCVLQFRQVPKPGQTTTFQNIDSLQDLLRK